MSDRGYDYGAAGTVGIGTPQANPTVEAEMRVLIPPAALVAVARLTSRSPDPATRLRDYLERLKETLAQYDSLALSAFGFACTASSYLVGSEREQLLLAELESHFGYPIITATAAIRWRLEQSGARRIAIAMPYTRQLAEAAACHWRRLGYDVVAVRRIETGSADTRSIYALGSADARPMVTELSALDVDVVLLSGTGMPTLPLIAAAPERPLLLSSNLCLAQRLCSILGLAVPQTEDWRASLAEATLNLEVP